MLSFVQINLTAHLGLASMISIGNPGGQTMVSTRNTVMVARVPGRTVCGADKLPGTIETVADGLGPPVGWQSSGVMFTVAGLLSPMGSKWRNIGGAVRTVRHPDLDILSLLDSGSVRNVAIGVLGEGTDIPFLLAFDTSDFGVCSLSIHEIGKYNRG
jgi:hypothetical protein